ncbi:MAG: hypothetical protein A2081_05515 [Elusimicrobia bacterium GWC2_61_19]|nr:MAG: hypothetical protein A2081_05515 [Elusimicrobia bacterium GWC2_61_19]
MREIIAAILSAEDEAGRLVAAAAAHGRAMVLEAGKKAREITEAAALEARQAAERVLEGAQAEAAREKEALLAAAAAEIEKNAPFQGADRRAAVDFVVEEVLRGGNARN